MTSKQAQGHQNLYELVDLKQSYNNAKLEKPSWNIACEKANDRVFVNLENVSVVSLKYVRKSRPP